MVLCSDEFRLNSTTVALSGGEDYELLFTINQKDYNKLQDNPDFSIIGYVTKIGQGVNLVSKLNQKVPIISQGWKSL